MVLWRKYKEKGVSIFYPILSGDKTDGVSIFYPVYTGDENIGTPAVFYKAVSLIIFIIVSMELFKLLLLIASI